MKTLQDYMTGEQLQRIADQWEKTAGENISIEVMKEDIYAFGSELACLRLEHYFKKGICETDVLTAPIYKHGTSCCGRYIPSSIKGRFSPLGDYF